jgi:pyruvate/2-oxoglutarate dehydrogenase complex dihydrolipoamide dehydrogenase (E3) component
VSQAQTHTGAEEQGRINRVVIIGTGLIGASMGCALSNAGYVVYLRDHKISMPEWPLVWVPGR